jgi:hypothetical protein
MKKFIWLIGLFLMPGCSEEDFEPALDYVSYFDFIDGNQNWEASVSNYSLDLEQSFQYELIHQSYFFDGNNKTALELKLQELPKNAFVYLRNNIKGLKPETQYQVTFEIEQQYNFASILATIPDVYYYKVGFSNVKPESVITEQNNQENKIVLNLELPNSQINYNTINLSDDLTKQPNHESRTLDNFDNPLLIRTNENGEFWVLYGHTINEISTYSILFDTIIIYYEEIEVRL